MFIGVPGRADDAEIQAFVNEQGVNGFEHVIDPDGSLWARLSIRSQPSFAFINDDGTIETHRGALGEAELSQRVDDLLSR